VKFVYFCAMIKKMLFVGFILVSLVFTSCSNYNKLLKSTDNETKFEAAVDYFERKDYNRALELFDLLQAAYRGTAKGEDISYYTAYCYYNLKDYTVASYYFKRYVQSYPQYARAEECSFMSAYCYYLDSPRYSLDQTNTYLAINELQLFTDTYPNSERVAEANELIDNLREKLELKDFNISIMYYRMRDYMAAITSFENLLKNYPDTERREEVLQYMALAYYEFAENSIPEKKRERYESAVEAYNNLLYLYPESEFLSDLKEIDTKARQRLESYQ